MYEGKNHLVAELIQLIYIYRVIMTNGRRRKEIPNNHHLTIIIYYALKLNIKTPRSFLNFTLSEAYNYPQGYEP